MAPTGWLKYRIQAVISYNRLNMTTSYSFLSPLLFPFFLRFPFPLWFPFPFPFPYQVFRQVRVRLVHEFTRAGMDLNILLRKPAVPCLPSPPSDRNLLSNLMFLMASAWVFASSGIYPPATVLMAAWRCCRRRRPVLKPAVWASSTLRILPLLPDSEYFSTAVFASLPALLCGCVRLLLRRR